MKQIKLKNGSIVHIRLSVENKLMGSDFKVEYAKCPICNGKLIDAPCGFECEKCKAKINKRIK